nr:hypothetical protein [Tanacetum cinerariifolium]
MNLLNEDVGNVSVLVKLHGVLVTAFSEDGLSVIATKLGTPLMLDSYTSDMCLQSWRRTSYSREMIELRADLELKDTIMVVMLKLTGEGFYTCTVRVEYDGNKKKVMEPTKEVSNSNLFVVLNLVKNDGELGTNGGTSNLASDGADSSGSSFWNVETSSTGTTSIVDKIEKLGKLIIDGKVTLVDNDGKSLKNIDYPGDHDSEDEVESVGNDMTRSMSSEKVSFGTTSLLEQ